VIQTEVEDALSEKVLAGDFEHGDLVTVDMQDDQLTFYLEEDEEDLPVAEMENGEAPPTLETVLS
jgi:hypothetical protein